MRRKATSQSNARPPNQQVAARAFAPVFIEAAQRLFERRQLGEPSTGEQHDEGAPNGKPQPEAN